MNSLTSLISCQCHIPRTHSFFKLCYGWQGPTHILEELLGHNAGPGIDRQLHLTDLFVNLLHEVDYKVHQFVFVHLLRVEVGDEKADVIPLGREVSREGGEEMRQN